jgi:hypothetical protein
MMARRKARKDFGDGIILFGENLKAGPAKYEMINDPDSRETMG